MRESRQITVLRSLFATLHPKLKSGLENRLAPARRLRASIQESAPDSAAAKAAVPIKDSSTTTATSNDPTTRPTNDPTTDPTTEIATGAQPQSARPVTSATPLPRSLTDEHLVTELETITRQYELPNAPRKPQRGRRHYSRDTLLSLLEEAKVRIQVLETELELARGTEESIPLLTEEWSDDLPSVYSRKPD